MHIMSGVMKPLLTPVGVQMKRSGPRRAEMLPPLPSQYSRAQMRRPMSQICSLIVVASFDAKSAMSAALYGAGAATGAEPAELVAIAAAPASKTTFTPASVKTSFAPGVSRISLFWRNSFAPVFTKSAASF